MHLADITMFYARRGGGVARYLGAKHRWLARQPELRHSVVVPRRAALPGPLPLCGARGLSLPLGGGYRFPLTRAWGRDTLCRLAPDVIEAGDPYVLAWAALEAGQTLGVPVVGFYHSDLPRLIGMRAGKTAAKLARRYVGLLYSQFDLVLAPSRVMVQQLALAGVRAVHQPLGVDTTLFHPGLRDSGLRRELGLAPGTRLLVHVGRAAREKNLDLLAESFARLGRPYHLLLVGSEVSDLGGRGRHAGNITCLSYRNSVRDVARIIASSDAFVHAGDKETFGLVVLEAYACGVPVVGMAAGGVGELVSEATGQRVARCDAGALAEAIHGLYARDPHALGLNARTYAEQYDWNAVLPRLLLKYEHLRTGMAVSDPAAEPTLAHVER